MNFWSAIIFQLSAVCSSFWLFQETARGHPWGDGLQTPQSNRVQIVWTTLHSNQHLLSLLFLRNHGHRRSRDEIEFQTRQITEKVHSLGHSDNFLLLLSQLSVVIEFLREKYPDVKFQNTVTLFENSEFDFNCPAGYYQAHPTPCRAIRNLPRASMRETRFSSSRKRRSLESSLSDLRACPNCKRFLSLNTILRRCRRWRQTPWQTPWITSYLEDYLPAQE